ncbi:MAG: phosphoribosyltransferase family protein [Bdellovibrionota bacterium]
MTFADREEAGRLLAEKLLPLDLYDPFVLALPRGGVPVAREVSQALGCPLDVLVVRKIGHPDSPEYAIGAIAEDAQPELREPELASDEMLASAREEVERRIGIYRQGRRLPDLHGRSVIVVDDGIATGSTAAVALRYLRNQGVSPLILAVPVCSSEAFALLEPMVDQLITLDVPPYFQSVGQWYVDFRQLTDEDVLEVLRSEREIVISPEPGVKLHGALSIPPSARGLVIFAHGSGSSRKSPRNRMVARALQEMGLGTLLFDLLSQREAESRENVFDIPFLAKRLKAVTQILREDPRVNSLGIGFFGASTGGAAALWAAAELGPEVIRAVVSRGGRPDLAMPKLSEVQVPSLLIVGSLDQEVLELNKMALRRLKKGELQVVPGATHLFEEEGTLERVSAASGDWFLRHLPATKARKARKARGRAA